MNEDATITFRLSESLNAAIAAEAKKHRRKKSDFIRLILEDYFAEPAEARSQVLAEPAAPYPGPKRSKAPVKKSRN